MPDLQSPEFLKGLKQLQLLSEHDFSGQRVGERKTRRKGSSVEFKDYKEYNPGDDIRFIDWNLWGRLDRYYIKLFYNEENLNVFFLMDTSSSMGYGEPGKWNFCLQFTAAVSFLALCNQDIVHYYPMQKNLVKKAPVGKNPAYYPKIVQYLSRIEPTGETMLSHCVDQFVKFERKKGLIFFISDFFHEPEEVEYCFKKLRHYRYEVVPLLLLAPQEIDPPFHGLCQLSDMETNEEMELEVSGEYLTIYQEAVDNHRQQVMGLSQKYGFNGFEVQSDQFYRDVVIKMLRRGKA